MSSKSFQTGQINMNKAKEKMKQLNKGFTLVEMLVVIAIIAILASILIPVVARAKTKAKIATAKIQMAEIDGAIKSYKNDYERYPMPKGISANKWGDVTFTSDIGALYDNAKMVEILTNPNHARNPKKNKYLDVKESSEPASSRRPGLSSEGRYLDPLGNEYVISMDKNRDGFCADNYYGKIGAVRVGGTGTLHSGIGIGLEERSFGAAGTAFVLKGEVMIWSAGPDRLANPAAGALDKENADNIIHWK